MNIEEILEFLFGPNSASEITTMDKFKERFSGGDSPAFVSSAALADSKSPEFLRFLPRAVGQLTGKSTTILKRKLGEMGVDVSGDEIKDKPFEDVLETAMSKVIAAHGTLKTELAKGQSDAVKDWEAKYGTLESKYNDLTRLHGDLKTQYDNDRVSHQKELSEFKMKTIRDQKHQSIKWRDGIKDVERTGYFTNLNSNYKFQLNDKGDDIEVLDKEGKRIPNPKQAGTWKTYEQVMEEQGVSDGVFSVSDNARETNRKNRTFEQRNERTDERDTDKKPDVKISSRFKLPG